MIRIIMWEWRLIATTVLRPIMFCLLVSWWPDGVPGREQIFRHVEQCSGCSCELRSVVYRWWVACGVPGTLDVSCDSHLNLSGVYTQCAQSLLASCIVVMQHWPGMTDWLFAHTITTITGHNPNYPVIVWVGIDRLTVSQLSIWLIKKSALQLLLELVAEDDEQ